MDAVVDEAEESATVVLDRVLDQLAGRVVLPLSVHDDRVVNAGDAKEECLHRSESGC